MIINRPSIPTLKFGLGNAKLAKSIGTFSMPAGWSCPFAKECASKAAKSDGLIKDGKHCQWRCFAASQEALYPTVRAARWHNFDSLRAENTVQAMANQIQRSLPMGISTFRVHVSGDFFNESYFLAWLNVAKNNPDIVFYGYTKATPFLVDWRKKIPSNFRFTASFGGTHDDLITKHKLKYAKVVFSPEEATRLGMEIDHDDSLAFAGKKSFLLLLHGTQPINSEANEALKKLRQRGIGGYGENSPHRHTVATTKTQVRITITRQVTTTRQGLIKRAI
jgi:hypothetical protein